MTPLYSYTGKVKLKELKEVWNMGKTPGTRLGFSFAKPKCATGQKATSWSKKKKKQDTNLAPKEHQNNSNMLQNGAPGDGGSLVVPSTLACLGRPGLTLDALPPLPGPLSPWSTPSGGIE